ncbi:MAG: alcohol dehydrogenase catalytic domain-containing protein [Thermoleophilia bacterium]
MTLSAVVTGPNHLEVVISAPLDPGPGDAVVQIVSSGICGTDVSILKGGIPVASGRVLGHEGAGLVQEAPAGSDLEQGTPVLVDPVISCGDCGLCRDGHQNLCRNGGLLGRDMDGLFTNAAAVPVTNLYRLPPDFDIGLGPLLQVVATVVRAQDAVTVASGDVAVVIGLGFTGQLHAQLLRHRGVRVLGIGRSEGKRALASHLACEWVATPDEAAVALAEVAPDGARLVVEAAGTMAALRNAIALVRPGGTILCYGTYTDTEARLPFYDLYLKEIDLISTRASRPRDMNATLALVVAGAFDLEPLVSDRLPLDRAPEALDLSSKGALKVLMTHARR